MAKLCVSDRLRREIETCGVTRYKIAQETGVEQATLCRFVSGERGISMEVIDKLAAYFDLALEKKG